MKFDNLYRPLNYLLWISLIVLSQNTLSQNQLEQDSLFIPLDSSETVKDLEHQTLEEIGSDSIYLPYSNEELEEIEVQTLKKLNDNRDSSQSKVISLSIISLSVALFFVLLRLKKGKGKAVSEIEQLTKQELNIFKQVLSGKSNNEISQQCFISLSTVKTHINNIYRKLNISSREELKDIWGGHRDDLRD